MVRRIALFLTLACLTACTTIEEDSDMPRSDEGLGSDDTSQMQPWSMGQPSVTRQLTTGNRSRQMSVQSGFIRPGMFTVSFGVQVVDQPDNMSAPTVCEATIEWMVAGNTIIRRMSIVDGTAIQGEAEAVRVTVKDLSDGALGTLGRRYNIALSIAPGSRASSSLPPMLYGGINVLAPAGGIDLDIPQQAGIKGVMVLVASPGNSILEQHATAALTDVTGQSFATYDPRNFQWVPIPPGATRLSLTNNGADPQTYTVFYMVDG